MLNGMENEYYLVLGKEDRVDFDLSHHIVKDSL